jgi:hypothetical protein
VDGGPDPWTPGQSVTAASIITAISMPTVVASIPSLRPCSQCCTVSGRLWQTAIKPDRFRYNNWNMTNCTRSEVDAVETAGKCVALVRVYYYYFNNFAFVCITSPNFNLNWHVLLRDDVFVIYKICRPSAVMKSEDAKNILRICHQEKPSQLAV